LKKREDFVQERISSDLPAVSTTPVDKSTALRRVRQLVNRRATGWFVDGTPLASAS
jgi:hypothetical protein